MMAKGATRLKEWTVMVYLAGDNSLSEECVWSLKEMYRAFSNSREIALVVQIDPTRSRIRRYDLGRDLERLKKENRSKVSPKTHVVKSYSKRASLDVSRSILSPRLATGDTDGGLFDAGRSVTQVVARRRASKSASALTGRVSRVRKSIDNMASPKVLTGFIRHCKRTHPARRYLLILSGHGGGALGHSFLVDDFPASALSMSQLSDALAKAGGGIDVLGMDSCGMGMAEVGYELRDSVDYMVASEGFERNTGWPYHRVLEFLNEKPGKIEPRALAAKIVDVHTQYYSDYIMAGVSTDIAACYLEKSEELAAAVAQLATVLRRNLPKNKRNTARSKDKVHVEDLALPDRVVADAVILAHWRAQSYRFEQNTDLYDFCELLGKGCSCSDDTEVVEACERVKVAIKGKKEVEKLVSTGKEVNTNADGYVIKSCRSGSTFQYSNGVSIYFPWATFLRGYKGLSFSKRTKWNLFLQAYVEKTRRRPRHSCHTYGSVPGGDSPADVRDVLTVGDRDVLTVGDRDVLTVGDRDVLTVGDRDVLTVGDRDVLAVGDKGGQMIVPEVKNPPKQFLLAKSCSRAPS